MKRVKRFLSNNTALVGLVLLVILGVCIQRTFLSWSNLSSLLRSVSITGFIAVGMTFVVLCGSIDLSVGSVFAVCGFLMLHFSQYSIVLAFLISMVFAVAIGFINGVLITKLSIPPFIGTMATMELCRGLVQMFTGETTYKIANTPAFILGISKTDLFGFFPLPFFLFILAALIASYILRRRIIGRSMFIVGGNKEAAKMMGVSVFKTTTVAHIICSVFAGLGGILFMSRTGVATPLAGVGYEMYAIAAVVIGGASLNGGIGKMSGSFIGALIMSSFTNIFSLQSLLDPVWQDVVIGGILLVVIWIQAFIVLRSKKSRAVCTN